HVRHRGEPLRPRDRTPRPRPLHALRQTARLRLGRGRATHATRRAPLALSPRVVPSDALGRLPGLGRAAESCAPHGPAQRLMLLSTAGPSAYQALQRRAPAFTLKLERFMEDYGNDN